jgi:Uma2 family endonuclease
MRLGWDTCGPVHFLQIISFWGCAMDVSTEIALDPDKEYEIIHGSPEEKEMGSARHGGIGARLIARLSWHVEDRNLGGVYGPDTTYLVGGNDRLPDVSFVSASRIPEDGEPEGKWLVAPDLAVEIISPTDLYEKVVGKVEDYLKAGVKQVWLISPEHRTVTIYSSLTQTVILTDGDDLPGGDVVPDFTCRVAELFRQPARKGAELAVAPEPAQPSSADPGD